MTFFFFKQKTAYKRRISDWSSDVCSSDLLMILPLTRPASEFQPTWSPILNLPVMSFVSARSWRYWHARRQCGVIPGPGMPAPANRWASDRKSVVEGKRVSVRVDLGGRVFIKNKTNSSNNNTSCLQA